MISALAAEMTRTPSWFSQTSRKHAARWKQLVIAERLLSFRWSRGQTAAWSWTSSTLWPSTRWPSSPSTTALPARHWEEAPPHVSSLLPRKQQSCCMVQTSALNLNTWTPLQRMWNTRMLTCKDTLDHSLIPKMTLILKNSDASVIQWTVQKAKQGLFTYCHNKEILKFRSLTFLL